MTLVQNPLNAYHYELEVIHAVFNGGLTPNACDVLSALEPEMFSNGVSRSLWSGLKKLYAAGEIIDASTMFPLYESVDPQYGLSLAADHRRDCVGSPGNVKGYAKRVRQAYNLRNSRDVLTEALSVIENCHTEMQIGEVSKAVEKALQSIVVETDTKRPRSFDQIVTDYMDVLDNRINGSESERMIKVGIEAFDEITGGFNQTDLIVLGGCPGMGKTEFLMRLIRGVCCAGMGSLMFSMEMSEFQVIERAISGEGALPVGKLRTPEKMLDEDYARLSMGIGNLQGKGLYVQDSAGLSVDEICAQATRHKAEHPELALIGVDYLGLIKTEGLNNNLTIALGQISGRLKKLAKDLNVPVVLLTQLVSKDIEKRPLKNRVPNPSDIKDSSRVQDDSDWIIFPHRQKVYDPKAPDVAEIYFGKARHGIAGSVCYQLFKDGHFVDVNQAWARSEMDSYYSGGKTGDSVYSMFED